MGGGLTIVQLRYVCLFSQLSAVIYCEQSPTSATGMSSAAFTSPTFQNRSEPIGQRVLLTVTADCDNYTYLDVSGAQNAAIIKEKIFSKVRYRFSLERPLLMQGPSYKYRTINSLSSRNPPAPQ